MHENTKLLRFAVPGKLNYKKLTNLCECDLTDWNCMFHLCEKCPDIANFRNIFKISFDQNDFDDDDKINHKHWVANN